ncbi:hypothetical protein PAALTS15_03702 [Paenibacillus alvei TS-15]|uniref:Uncharacterized protein n=1 Tax=Paenibacillus alvei TS-15 TaxID=1117108 RepID=S9SX20_PAEAL|nr:hypothetical protein PAALTS15_03702 [Paenibacillus alvei TS-15]
MHKVQERLKQIFTNVDLSYQYVVLAASSKNKGLFFLVTVDKIIADNLLNIVNQPCFFMNAIPAV